MSNLTPFLTTAIEAADQAGALVRRYFHQPVRRERKLAASPIVTEADREAEKLIRQVIERAHPAFAVTDFAVNAVAWVFAFGLTALQTVLVSASAEVLIRVGERVRVWAACRARSTCIRPGPWARSTWNA